MQEKDVERRSRSFIPPREITKRNKSRKQTRNQG
jgi:hypothetical protein